MNCQIIRGIQLAEPRKAATIDKYAPSVLRGSIRRFAGVAADGNSESELFASGKKVYFSAALQKPQTNRKIELMQA